MRECDDLIECDISLVFVKEFAAVLEGSNGLLWTKNRVRSVVLPVAELKKEVRTATIVTKAMDNGFAARVEY